MMTVEQEIEANELAMEILMPETQFLQAFNEASSMEEVADKFKVTVSMASTRALTLTGKIIM